MAATHEHPAGETIPGTVYQVVRSIGAGAMGTVYDVEDTTIGKRYVLKTLHPELGNRADLARRMQNEASALARLGHPNIVEVMTAGVTADELRLPYFVMDRLNGQSLRGILQVIPATEAPLRRAASKASGLTSIEIPSRKTTRRVSRPSGHRGRGCIDDGGQRHGRAWREGLIRSAPTAPLGEQLARGAEGEVIKKPWRYPFRWTVQVSGGLHDEGNEHLDAPLNAGQILVSLGKERPNEDPLVSRVVRRASEQPQFGQESHALGGPVWGEGEQSMSLHDCEAATGRRRRGSLFRIDDVDEQLSSAATQSNED